MTLVALILISCSFSMATEVFRFMLARLAEKDTDSIQIHPEYLDRSHPDLLTRTVALSASLATASRSLKYYVQIAKLDSFFGPQPIYLTQLDTNLVRQSIENALPGETLSTLVKSNGWRSDVQLLDYALFQIWAAASDPGAIG